MVRELYESYDADQFRHEQHISSWSTHETSDVKLAKKRTKRLEKKRTRKCIDLHRLNEQMRLHNVIRHKHLHFRHQLKFHQSLLS